MRSPEEIVASAGIGGEADPEMIAVIRLAVREAVEGCAGVYKLEVDPEDEAHFSDRLNRHFKKAGYLCLLLTTSALPSW